MILNIQDLVVAEMSWKFNTTTISPIKKLKYLILSHLVHIISLSDKIRAFMTPQLPLIKTPSFFIEGCYIFCAIFLLAYKTLFPILTSTTLYLPRICFLVIYKMKVL